MIKDSEFAHMLVADKSLLKKIESARKKYRPYLKSRNAFIVELILLGIQKLNKEVK